MSKLFMKTSRHGDHRTFAWLKSAPGHPVLGPFTARQSVAESGEFDFLLERGRASGVGAGGGFEYRIYDLAAETQFPYAIVYPTIPSVRETFPHACRLVNLRTGEESALCDTLEHAQASLALALQGRLKGSFGARRA